MSFWADVLVHTALFMGFLPAFFFLQVSPTQSKGLERDFMEIIKPTLANVALLTNPNTNYQELNQTIQSQVTNVITNPDLQSQDQTIQSTNTTILRNLSIVVGVVAPILFLSGIYLAQVSGVDMVEFAISNLIVITFIAMSEFAIVGLFFSQFVEIDSYFVKASLAKRMTFSSTYGDCFYVSNWLQSILPASIYNKFFNS